MSKIIQCKIAGVAVTDEEEQTGTEIMLTLVDERGETARFQLTVEASQELLVALKREGFLRTE